jgi:hypothetical protein
MVKYCKPQTSQDSSNEHLKPYKNTRQQLARKQGTASEIPIDGVIMLLCPEFKSGALQISSSFLSSSAMLCIPTKFPQQKNQQRWSYSRE